MQTTPHAAWQPGVTSISAAKLRTRSQPHVANRPDGGSPFPRFHSKGAQVAKPQSPHTPPQHAYRAPFRTLDTCSLRAGGTEQGAAVGGPMPTSWKPCLHWHPPWRQEAQKGSQDLPEERVLLLWVSELLALRALASSLLRVVVSRQHRAWHTPSSRARLLPSPGPGTLATGATHRAAERAGCLGSGP